MLTRSIAILLGMLLFSCAAARPGVPSAVAEREILDIERAWDDAEVHRDGAALDAILDDRFVFTYGGEAPIDKATVMRNVLASHNPSPSTPSEQRVLVDRDVAIATGVETVDMVVDGKTVKKASRYTTTFAHRDGHWRALSVHMAPVPPAPADATNRP
jgi:hypothetical protein